MLHKESCATSLRAADEAEEDGAEAATASGRGAEEDEEDEEDEDDKQPTQEELQHRKEANIRALLDNRCACTRPGYTAASALRSVLNRGGVAQPAGLAESAAAKGAIGPGSRARAAGSVQEPAPAGAGALRRTAAPQGPAGTACSLFWPGARESQPDCACAPQALRRKLIKRRVFVPWGCSKALPVLTPSPAPAPAPAPAEVRCLSPSRPASCSGLISGLNVLLATCENRHAGHR